MIPSHIVNDNRGWRSCIVYTNEVISEIWRTDDAMSSLCSSWLYSLWHQWVSNATVAKPADGSFKHYDEAKIYSSSNRPVSSISKGWGCEPSAEFLGFITRRSLASWYKLPSHSQKAHHKPKPTPSSKSMNSAPFIAKKILNVGFWLRWTRSLSRSKGFVCGRRTI